MKVHSGADVVIEVIIIRSSESEKSNICPRGSSRSIMLMASTVLSQAVKLLTDVKKSRNWEDNQT